MRNLKIYEKYMSDDDFIDSWHDALSNGDYDRIVKLSELKEDYFINDIIIGYDDLSSIGYCIAHKSHRSFDIIKFLVEDLHLDVNKKSEDISNIQLAIAKYNSDVLHYLLMNGADINTTVTYGGDIMGVACQCSMDADNKEEFDEIKYCINALIRNGYIITKDCALFDNWYNMESLTESYDFQYMIFRKYPQFAKFFIDKVEIDEKIKNEFDYLIEGDELGLL